MNIPRILIAEDEPKVAALLHDYLIANGLNADIVGRGDAVLPALEKQAYDVLLLDLRLPGMDGLAVLRALTRSQIDGTPVPGVIIISALVEEVDKLLGLELGADDYICKPFSAREVVARVKALLRRRSAAANMANGADTAAAAETMETTDAASKTPQIRLDAARMQCTVDGKSVALTAVEFRLMQALVAHPGRIFSRSQLMAQLYSDHRVVADRTVDSHVKKIRRKLEAVLPDWGFIDSVYGAGFRIEPRRYDAEENNA